MLTLTPPWAARVAKVAGCAAALLCAFATGTAFRRPPETKTVERVVYKDRVVEKRVEVKVAAERKVVYRDRTVKPDGTRVEREVERTDTDTRTGETVVRSETHEGETRVEVSVASRPDWRLSLMGGAALQLAPLSASPLIGLAVERRLAGPFSVGLWTLYSHPGGLALGASLSIEF